jgi:hypothetical protein
MKLLPESSALYAARHFAPETVQRDHALSFVVFTTPRISSMAGQLTA